MALLLPSLKTLATSPTKLMPVACACAPAPADASTWMSPPLIIRPMPAGPAYSKAPYAMASPWVLSAKTVASP
jgi:hypothetical protein